MDATSIISMHVSTLIIMNIAILISLNEIFKNSKRKEPEYIGKAHTMYPVEGVRMVSSIVDFGWFWMIEYYSVRENKLKQAETNRDLTSRTGYMVWRP